MNPLDELFSGEGDGQTIDTETQTIDYSETLAPQQPSLIIPTLPFVSTSSPPSTSRKRKCSLQLDSTETIESPGPSNVTVTVVDACTQTEVSADRESNARVAELVMVNFARKVGLDVVKQLHTLLLSGAISQQEFEEQKKTILSELLCL